MNATDRPPDPGPDRTRIPPYLANSWPNRADPAVQSRPAPALPSNRPRPFVLTAGRVQAADPDICLETQVSARSTPPPWAAPVTSLPPESQLIVALCAQPTSVAEISAQVPLHLGVARVLVSDLRATGHVDVHSMDGANPHDPDLILRVIRGLRAIT